MFIEWTRENDDGEEVTTKIPAKYEVCSDCEGHGKTMNESMRQHAYTQEEFQEAFPEDEDKAEYLNPNGIYSVTCPTCGGKRVELMPDWEAKWDNDETKDSELKKDYEKSLQADADYEALCRSERMIGA